MDLGAAGLSEQPFRTHDKPLSTISYASHRAALKVLDDTCAAANGLSLLQAPPLSGKSTLIHHFVATRSEEQSVAVVDGNGLNTTNLVSSVLREFGYEFDYGSPNELLGMLRVFALQQASTGHPPLLIIENTHALGPGALEAVCELADLQVRRVSALKLILVSDRSLQAIVEAPGMECIAKRMTHDFHLQPMTHDETVQYLQTKLRAAGCVIPDFIFPPDVCTELWHASGGWPGVLDRVAVLALAKAQTLPVGIDHIERPVLPPGTWEKLDPAAAKFQEAVSAGPPILYVSKDGAPLQELVLNMPRLLVGRSEHNDLTIPSRFISRHHVLFIRHKEITFLMDLNSANGTFVNSKRVSNLVLTNDDVISIGHHSIKFSDPRATKRVKLGSVELAKTELMKTIEEMRKQQAQENIPVRPAEPDNLSTSL